MKAFFPLVLAATLLVGCGEPSNTAPVAPTDATAKQDDTPPVKRAAVVKEVLHTERYTFARMDSCGEEAWVAGPVTELAVDQTVEMTGGMGMTDFKADTLDRTFEKILFVDAWAATEEPVKCKEEKKLDPDKPTQEFRIGTVTEVIDAPGYTYAKLDVCGDTVWVAAPTTRVEVGSYGATPIGDEMTEFESSALGRTFDSVWFVAWIKKSPQLPPCG